MPPMRVAAARLDRQDRAGVGAAEQGPHHLRAVAGEPGQQFEVGLRGEEAGLAEQAGEDRVRREQRRQLGRCAEAADEVGEPLPPVRSGQVAPDPSPVQLQYQRAGRHRDQAAPKAYRELVRDRGQVGVRGPEPPTSLVHQAAARPRREGAQRHGERPLPVRRHIADQRRGCLGHRPLDGAGPRRPASPRAGGRPFVPGEAADPPVRCQEVAHGATVRYPPPK
jgi:hypothetical protein